MAAVVEIWLAQRLDPRSGHGCPLRNFMLHRWDVVFDQNKHANRILLSNSLVILFLPCRQGIIGRQEACSITELRSQIASSGSPICVISWLAPRDQPWLSHRTLSE